jgi:TPR repeat protein
MQWVFETLGIDKQADASAVRKAYAKAIKQCDQATEADRFQRIRQAYEFALQWAKQRETPATPAPATPAQDGPAPAAEQPTARPHVAPLSTAPTAAPLSLTPLQPDALIPPAPAPSAPHLQQTAKPDQPPYAQPKSAPSPAFAPTPSTSPPLQQPPAAAWRTAQPVAAPPVRPRPVASVPAATPPVPTAPFKTNQRIVDPRMTPALDLALPSEAAQGSANAVLRELLSAARKPNVISVASVLGIYANDARLTSLDAKAEFEQALFVQIFASPVDVPMLDEACDLFAWETSHRHLGGRPELVHRMLRQQSLRHLLAASKLEDRRELDEAYRTYKIFQQQSQLRVEPWQIVNANRALERFAAFKHELDERYNAQAFDWWRQKLVNNPTLLTSYKENKPAQHAPPPAPIRRSQRSTGGRGGLLWLWPILAILGSIGGHFSPNNAPSYDPGAYTPPQRVSYQRPPVSPTPLVTNPRQMDFISLQRNAVQGDARAQAALAARYENGEGTARDVHQAMLWYGKAATQGLPDAQWKLSQIYKDGDGVPRNAPLAMEWLKKAAASGSAMAQNNLATAYATGDGVKKDYQQAYHWWLRAADRNVPGAQTGLGWLFANGYFVPRDATLAVSWYRKAAAQGDITAQVNLALMYERGDGVIADPVVAAALLTVATDHEDIYAKNGQGWKDLDRISAHFTPAQNSAVDQLSRDLSSPRTNFLTALDSAMAFRHAKR